MLPNVLERKRKGMPPHDRPEVSKTIQNGPLTVYNVPHIERKHPGPNGEMFQLKLNVAYKLAEIFEYMQEMDLTEYKYDRALK